jgi:3'-5' exonuclease
MYTRAQLENVLFLDIETASITANYADLPDHFQHLWNHKAELLHRNDGATEMNPAEMYHQRAAIFAEFGKVVCVSCGFIRFQDDQPHFRLKSFFGADEKAILAGFAELVNGFTTKQDRTLCAHNGKEFDFPYLGRRYLINGMQLPTVLADLQSKKPWEVRLLDTMQIWKFGDYKSFTSLDLLCAVMGVPSPKSGMDGSRVGKAFWEEKAYASIAHYCEGDVLATAQVMLRMSGQPLVQPAHVVAV